MSAVPFHYIDLRAFCYVTEDDKRVEAALRTVLPEEFELERSRSEGHHGDRILVFSARVENADDIRTVLDAVGELADRELERVRRELDERITESCEFYLSLDKQAAFRGEVELGEGITLRGKVEAYPANPEAAVENAREALEEL